MHRDNNFKYQNTPFLIIPNAFPQDFLDNITECAKNCKDEQGELYGGGLQRTVRSSTIKWIFPEDDMSSYIYQYIGTMLENTSRNYFGYDVFTNGCEGLQYTTYEYKNGSKVQDHYGWHMDCDVIGPEKTDRKVSFSLQLSDPEDYDGCELDFMDWSNARKEDMLRKGTAILFPSFLYHRVTPITRGKRTALVGWIRGPKLR